MSSSALFFHWLFFIHKRNKKSLICSKQLPQSKLSEGCTRALLNCCFLIADLTNSSSSCRLLIKMSCWHLNTCSVAKKQKPGKHMLSTFKHVLQAKNLKVLRTDFEIFQSLHETILVVILLNLVLYMPTTNSKPWETGKFQVEGETMMMWGGG